MIRLTSVGIFSRAPKQGETNVNILCFTCKLLRMVVVPIPVILWVWLWTMGHLLRLLGSWKITWEHFRFWWSPRYNLGRRTRYSAVCFTDLKIYYDWPHYLLDRRKLTSRQRFSPRKPLPASQDRAQVETMTSSGASHADLGIVYETYTGFIISFENVPVLVCILHRYAVPIWG